MSAESARYVSRTIRYVVPSERIGAVPATWHRPGVSDLYSMGGDGAVLLAVHVQPGASRSGLVGRYGSSLRARVTAPPEGGRANAAVCRLVAEALGVRPDDVQVVAGATSRRKRLRIVGVSPDRLDAWLRSVAPGG